MKIRMLGTGYGACKIKRAASKDYRHLGGVTVNEKILIDAPRDLFDAADALGLSDILEQVRVILISHSHEGHFCPETVARLAKKRKITVLADRELLSLLPESENIGKYPLVPRRAVELGGGCRIIPLPSAHITDNPRETALNFLICDDKKLLYALDGGIIGCQYLDILRDEGLDAAILDAAEELNPPSERLLYHGSLDSAKMLSGILRGMGAASERTKFVLSHIPTSKKRSIHDELRAAAEGTGIAVAYDGYYLSI